MACDNADLELAKGLYERIKERYLGSAVNSVSGSGRSVSYSDADLKQLIQFYRQTRARLTPEQIASACLPDIEDPDAPIATSRRRPGVYIGRRNV